jgi:hypothetical protein
LVFWRRFGTTFSLCEMRYFGVVAVFLPLVAACTPARPRPPLPSSPGTWVTFDVDVPGRDSRDLLRSFEASAQALGCTSDRGGGWSTGLPGGGFARVYSAVLARCDDGAIGMIAVEYTRVRLGCPKPASRDECEALLNKISEAR